MLDAFPGFTESFEGALHHLYLDVLGIPTTGYGNALFSTAAACALPWRHPDGSFASRDEIIAMYATIRNMKGNRDPHGVLWTQRGGGAFAPFSTLRLDASGVSELVRGTIQRNDEALKRRYGGDYETWPACAQIAVHGLAWAAGNAYLFPKMDRALANRDFTEASREIEMPPTHNPGNHLERRNHAHEILMLNAAYVEAVHLDPDLIDWEHELRVCEADTEPEMLSAASLPTIYPAPPGDPDAA